MTTRQGGYVPPSPGGVPRFLVPLGLALGAASLLVLVFFATRKRKRKKRMSQYGGKISEVWRLRNQIFWALTKENKNPGISPAVALGVGVGVVVASLLVWRAFRGEK